MGTVETLALALGTAWTSGINLYATVAVLGLAHHAGLIDLPPELQETVANPFVIGVASVMYMVEFFADKIPYVDNAWDTQVRWGIRLRLWSWRPCLVAVPSPWFRTGLKLRPVLP